MKISHKHGGGLENLFFRLLKSLYIKDPSTSLVFVIDFISLITPREYFSFIINRLTLNFIAESIKQGSKGDIVKKKIKRVLLFIEHEVILHNRWLQRDES